MVNAVAARDGSVTRESDAIAVVRASMVVLSGVAVLLGVVAAALTATGSLPRWLGLPQDLVASPDRWAVFLAIMPFAFSLPFGIGQRILVGLGRAHVVNLLAALTPIVALAATASLITLGAPALYLGVATPVGILFSAIAMFFVAVRQSGWSGSVLLRKRDSAQTGVLSGALWAAAAPMLVITIASPVGQQSGRIVLANVSSAHELAQYSLAFQFYLPAVSVASAAGVTLWSTFARRSSGQRRGLLVASGYMLALGLALSVGFTLLINPVAQLVSHGQIKVSFATAASLGALILFTSALQAPGMLLTRPNLLAIQAVCAVAMCVVTVGLSVLLAPGIGAAGPALAAAIGVLVGQLIPTMSVALWVTKGSS
ncbi:MULTISPECIES: hypothetical protein [unclassified Microbacterium]|uniref:hypothetical protein n=1 Tax=unclassified Microbacterium TaxID=2609290 RepID=UPI003C2EFF72